MTKKRRAPKRRQTDATPDALVRPVNVRFGMHDYQQVMAAAKIEHLKLSQFVRQASLKAAEELMQHVFEANGVAVQA